VEIFKIYLGGKSDSKLVSRRTNQKKDWECKEDISNLLQSAIVRAGEKDAPLHSRQQVLAGFNGLQTKFPDIAKSI
jgi:hypothetical protein